MYTIWFVHGHIGLAGMAAVSAGMVKFFWQGHYKFLKHL